MIYLQLLAGLRPRRHFCDAFKPEGGVSFDATQARSLPFVMTAVTWYMVKEGDWSRTLEGSGGRSEVRYLTLRTRWWSRNPVFHEVLLVAPVKSLCKTNLYLRFYKFSRTYGVIVQSISVLRPYAPESTGSRPISKVKLVTA